MPVAEEEKALTVTEQEEEWVRCSVNPYHFLSKYVKVEEPGIGAVPFLLLPHVVRVIHLAQTEKYLTILKSRQTYVTHTFCALSLHGALFIPSFKTAITSKGEEESKDVISYVKFMREHLPDFLNQSTGAYGAESITFPRNGGSIKALPSTESAGIGKHVSRVFMDEADFHEYAAEAFGMIKPTIDKNGSLVMVSTINPKSQVTFFKTVYRAAMKGEGQFKRFFIPWNVLPERNQKWLDKVCDNKYEESGMSKELYQATQYPSSEIEALSPPSAIAAFDHKNLNLMKESCEKPNKDLSDGVINIFRDFVVGHTYVCFTDTSEGTGRDQGVSVVLDMHTGLVVADICSKLLGPEDLAFWTNKMLERYKKPLWGIENNKRGIITCNTALSLGYPDLFYEDWQKEYKRDDLRKTKVGWNSGPTEGSTRHRVILWNEGISAVNKGEIRILSVEGLNHFYSVVRTPDKGRVEGVKGTNDDYPFAVCGAWQMTKFAHRPSRGPLGPISFI